MTKWSLATVLVSSAVADSRDFVFGNYHIPYHEATVDNSGIDCLQLGCTALGECAACTGHGSLGYCCNALDKTGACPDGMIDAIANHVLNVDHFGNHHESGMANINYCIEVQDFDYEGDGYLTTGIKYAIPYHAHDSESAAVDCFTDCDSTTGRCESCNYENKPGYCCPFVNTVDQFSCIDDHNDPELFEHIGSHFKNLNHLFDHHQNIPFHTCVTMDCTGVEIIGVDCRSDFKLKLTINLGCFKEEFKDVSVTDLILTPIGTDDDTNENSCTAYTDGATGDNYWYSDEALTTAGDSETCEIWFDISKCGLMPEVTTDKVIYKIGLSTYQDPNAVLVLKAGMSEREIVCEYEGDISVQPLNAGADWLLVDNQIGKSYEAVGAPASISRSLISASITVQDNTGVYQSHNTGEKVKLGAGVKVSFTGPDLSGFYIKNCVSSNDDESTELILVNDGCVLPSTSGVLADISPSIDTGSCTAGTCTATLQFSQFGFIGDEQTTVDQDLEFKLTCSISFGATPSCTGASRRNLENDKQSEAFISYACSMDNDTHVEDGIATKRESDEISSARILSSCTFLAMIFYVL